MFRYETRTDLMIARNPMEFIAGVSIPTSGSEQQREAKFSGKHAPHLMFLLDEADAIPDEVFRGIESCMSGGNTRLLCMFNPRTPSGAVYRMIRDGKAHVVKLTAFDHPNVATGEDVIPGAVDRPTTIRRINEWARPLAANEKPGADTFELPGFLEGAVVQSRAGLEFAPLKAGHYKIMDPAFSYMVLGEYPARAQISSSRKNGSTRPGCGGTRMWRRTASAPRCWRGRWPASMSRSSARTPMS